jgi:hypothetical protein
VLCQPAAVQVLCWSCWASSAGPVAIGPCSSGLGIVVLTQLVNRSLSAPEVQSLGRPTGFAHSEVGRD